MSSQAANLAMQLRLKWHSLFLRRMRSPSKPWSQVDENVIRAVIGVLTNEEQSLGLQQPAGIGQRPRPMCKLASVLDTNVKEFNITVQGGNFLLRVSASELTVSAIAMNIVVDYKRATS